ncbi:hydrolase [Lactobacillus hominis]|uniref:Cell wall-associated hydrolase n=1 Tax=Lactobacillus hominis DSM 23910 = CRBIP 24.179 TaxID=1423758 RepID=I7JVA5_9LACO|nr:hydrolase [Lactobacillus hominis]KRM85136.1 cell wall-associated hydrolase [Lactobacillus hominis DSM 23910 = CRBIP 24.179]CCI82496.1 Cell wall-associated hydrolase [Lactobacillus hominis DSM 23910 = CRBIP 24.179]
MFKRQFAVLLTAISFLILFGFTNTSTSSAEADGSFEVSSELVKETMKPQLLKKQLQDKKDEAIRNAKLKEVQAEQARLEKIEAEQKAAQEKAKAQELAKQKQASSQAPSANNTAQNNQSQSVSGVNKGTFKLSFYDPAAMGSNMGYGGVAANLSVFPRGTKLKITLPDGTVWIRVVNDTGGFAAANPRQLDVAMPNSQVPAAGVLMATVEVIG